MNAPSPQGDGTEQKYFDVSSDSIIQHTQDEQILRSELSPYKQLTQTIPIEGKAAFKLQLEILKPNHDGFELRLMAHRKRTKSLWMSPDNVLSDLKDLENIHASNLDGAYEYLRGLNKNGYNVYQIVCDTISSKLLGDIELSQTYKSRQKRDKTGKGLFKFNGQHQREYYDPATGKELSAKVVVKINSTRDSHIGGYPSLFVDIDDEPTGTKSNLEILKDAPILPSLIVQSSEVHKLQAYWRVDGIKDAEQYKKLQKALAHKFKSDPKVYNPSRIMRVAGFNHMKDINNPMPSKILFAEDQKQIHVDEFIQLMELDLTIAEKRSKLVKKSPEVIRPSKSTPIPSPTTRDVEALFDSCTSSKDIIKMMSLHWTEGKRHSLSFIGTKLLYKLGLSENQVLKIITDIAIKNDDQELSDRLKTIYDVFTYYEGREGLLANESNSRQWVTCFYSKIKTEDENKKRKSNKDVKKESLSRIYTFFFHNQLTDGVCGSISYRKVAEHTGIRLNKIGKYIKELEKIGCLKIRNKNTSSIRQAYTYHFVPLKTHEEYVLPIEREPTEDDLVRQKKRIKTFNIKRNIFKRDLDEYKASQDKAIELDQVTMASDFEDDLPQDDYVPYYSQEPLQDDYVEADVSIEGGGGTSNVPPPKEYPEVSNPLLYGGYSVEQLRAIDNGLRQRKYKNRLRV